MAADALDRLLTTLAICLHACSVCQVQHGWALAYSAFDAITIHFVLSGKGALRVGTGPVLPFNARSAVVVPAHQPHVLGELGTSVQLVHADEHCSMLGDGLVLFAAGDGNGVLGGGQALATRPDYKGLLGSVAVPTLVVIGLEDAVYAFPVSQMTKAAIPNAQLAVILGASHASIFERPELANQAILDWASIRR